MVKSQKLDRANIQDMLALTAMQEGMLLHFRTDPQNEQYFEQLSLTLQGEVSLAVIKEAWKFVVQNNEMLRTVFRWEKLEKPIQIILKHHSVPLIEVELAHLDPVAAAVKVEQIKKADLAQPIDITTEPLRLTCIHLGKGRYELLITYHHILFDGWSTGIVVKEFIEACTNLQAGDQPSTSKKSSIREFIKWYQRENQQPATNYWRDYFQGFAATPGLTSTVGIGTATASEQQSGSMIQQLTYSLPTELTDRMADFCKEQKITLATLLFTAWGTLLQRYTNSTDVVFGSTVSGRNANVPGIEQMVGLFINTLPLRIKKIADEPIGQLLKRVDQMMQERAGVQHTPLVEIKAATSLHQKEELFDTLVVLENYPLDQMLNQGETQGQVSASTPLQITDYSMVEKTNYKLTLAVSDLAGLKLDFAYDERIFSADLIHKISRHVEQIMSFMTSHPELPLDQMQLITDEEKESYLVQFNATSTELPGELTIHQLFEQQVLRTPEQIAVVFEEQELTYRELNQKANQLARRLRGRGVGPGQIVGLISDRSPELIIGILAILKAGGAYLPIDPAYPEERISFMLADSEVLIVLTQSALAERTGLTQELVLLDDLTLYQGEQTNLEPLSSGEDIIYIIYTSGSTGKPKGVMVPHRGVVNYITWAAKSYLQGESAAFPLYTSISFDLTVTSIFTPLLTGNQLVIYGEVADQLTIDRVLAENRVEIVKLTPAHLRILKEKDCRQSKIKRLIVGGEQLPTILARQIDQNFGGQVEIYNEYGPTEASVGCMIYRYDPERDQSLAVPIGHPADNMQIYLLDATGNLVPEQAPGEIWISGIGLALGYLNRPELTEDKFVRNPFDPHQQMYRTGDLARRLPSGEIEFLGRIDHQVKIRGYRIEPGEIEAEMLKYPRVKEVVVLPRQDQSGEFYLCAYLIAAQDQDQEERATGELTVAELREYLAQELPDYMIPSYFVQLEQLPLTPNGKIDRQALPLPEGQMATGAKYEAPSNELEEQLVTIWQEVLGVTLIGVNDDFFDLGGHSLKATSLVAKIHKQLDRQIPLSVMFKTPTIKGLAQYLQTQEQSIYSAIQPVAEQEYYPMSSAQKRLYTLQHFDPESTSYNIPAVFALTGELDQARFEKAFRQLIQRHESLRTSFSYQGDQLLQQVHPNVELAIDYLELTTEKELDQAIQRLIKPFDLRVAPLVRVALIRVSSNRQFLFIDMHHLITDGVSTDLLINEFSTLYAGQELTELRLQYKDFAAWQQQLFASAEMEKQAAYWLEAFQGEIPVLNLPTDFPRPAMQSFEGDQLQFELSPELTSKLRAVTKETGSTMYMLLLAAFNLLLMKYTGQEEIVVGSPIAGRPHADLEKIIGMFVNTLAMKNNPNRKSTFREFLQEVKKNALQAFEHQDYPFEELVEQLQIPRNLNRNPLFDVVFVMQNMDLNQLQLEQMTVEPYEFVNGIAKFDLTWTVVELDEQIGLSIEYCTKLFKQETIQQMYRHFVKTLETVVENLDLPLGQVELLTEVEIQQLLAESTSQVSYPHDKTIQQLFEEQVARTPAQIALVCQGAELTYAELNQQANRLARSLRQLGVERDHLVGVLVDRSLEMIVAVLAILKAGGAYLPIDPDYPEERISYTLQDSGARLLLTRTRFTENLEFTGEIIDLDDPTSYATDGTNLDQVNLPKDLAYVIYTSGTTGKPKGAMIEHRNVVRLLFNDQFQFDFTADDVWTMFHSYCFDFSVWEMYGALLYGGKLVLIPKFIAQDPREYLHLLQREKVTVLNQTPTAFYNLAKEALALGELEPDLSIRYVIFGGEALKPVMLREWRRRYPKTRLINMYGITETTVHVTFKEITEAEIETNLSNIGRPIPTLTTYVLDPDLKLVPLGVAGELCVGGAGVCRGYLNRPELTAEKFIANPYQPRERLYRSGDLVRRLPNGEMEYLGRIDHQVKIRGHRIELGEIENRLLGHPQVQETVVLARDDQDGNKYLVAYLVVTQQDGAEEKLTVAELREFLEQDLPGYMIPAYFVELAEMPMTSNGKVDRKALPEPDGNLFAGTDYLAPATETEEILVQLWQEVLGLDQIGVRDNFFTLGGDSIKALRLVSAINENLDQQLQIRSIYEYPAIQELAACVVMDQTSDLDQQLYQAELAVTNLQREILDDPAQAAKLPTDLEELYPVSDIQLGMIYHSLKNPEEAIYHDQLLYLMRDDQIDFPTFEQAIGLLTEKHPILRTSINLHDFAVPVQLVQQSFPGEVEYIDLKGQAKEAQDEWVNRYLAEDRKKPFTIDQPLWRVRIFLLDEQTFIFALICHHAILDGWSVASYVTELAKLYFTIKEPENANLIPAKLAHSYKEFVIEQLAIKENQGIKEFWQRELDGYQRTDLRQIASQLPGGSTSVTTLQADLDPELVKGLQKLASRSQTGLKTIYFTAYAWMIQMLSYENDLVVGLVEHSRPTCTDGDRILGCFLNTLPFRVQFTPEMTWQELLTSVHQKMTELKLYGKLPLVEIMDSIGESAVDGNPLFDTFFNFIDFHIVNDLNSQLIKENLDELKVESYARTNTLLDFTVYNMFGGGKVAMTYTDDLLTDQEADKLVQYFTNSLRLLTTAPEQPLSKVDTMTGAERELLTAFNQTQVDYPAGQTLPALFAEQVAKTPDHVAVVYAGEALTYRELNERANRLARFLREQGVGPDCLVGLTVERSHEMMVGIFAILKAGGAYLPIDPEYPRERTEYILADSQAKFLLTQERFAREVSFAGEIFCFEDQGIYAPDSSDLAPVATSQNLAYVIYTSGSTGRPKGVLIQHQSVVNRLFALQEKYPVRAEDAFLLKTTYMFDVSVAELFGWFMAGGRLVMLAAGAEKDQAHILRAIQENQITHLNFVPSILHSFLDLVGPEERHKLSSLKYVLIAGEAISKELIKKIQSLGLATRFENLYGPTEATIYTTTFDLAKPIQSLNVPIGQPLPNTEVLIVDQRGNLQPVGVPGELWIGGEGLAREYLNRPDLTAEKFSTHPTNPAARVYRSGDLARWLPDGNVEFMGRIDHQVKVRGYRIELGEIENQLVQIEAIREAIVMAKEDPAGDKYLCAYFVSTREVTVPELRESLLQELPDYMVPTYFVQLKEMPLTPNGKVNRKVLPEPVGESLAGSRDYEAPRNHLESQLARIWQEVLGLERVGISDNFFELGGHSLKVTSLVAKIHRELDQEVSLRQVFATPTIKELAKELESQEKSVYAEIQPLAEQAQYELSSGQKRIYTLQQLEPGSTIYNMPGVMEIEGPLDRTRLEQVFAKLIERHEVFRTHFILGDEGPVQVVSPTVEFEVEEFQIASEEQIDATIRDFIRVFDLKQAPLLRVGLITIGSEVAGEQPKYLLVFDMHHLISDGTSIGILIQEFTHLYAGDTLPELRIQYKDVAAWQQQLVNSERMKQQEEYWLARFKGDLPVLNLPTDWPRSETPKFAGERLSLEIDGELTEGLRGLAQETGATMYMVMLAAYNVLLARYSGQEDVVVGTPIAGRPHADLENIVGMFVNTLALRNYPAGEKTFAQFLTEVKENTLLAYENQDYQFEELVMKLGLPRNTGRNPLFDVFMNMIDIDVAEIQVDELTFKPYQFDNKLAKFELSFIIEDQTDSLGLTMVYNTHLYSKETIEQLADSYLTILTSVTADPALKLSQIELFAKAESDQTESTQSMLDEFDDDFDF